MGIDVDDDATLDFSLGIAARAIVPPDATCSTPPVVIPPEKQS